MNDVMLSVDVTIAKYACDDTTGDERAKLHAAWEAVAEGSLSITWGNEGRDHLFRAGVGGLMLHVGAESPMGKRLSYEIRQLRKLNALINASREGLSVGLGGIVDDTEERQEPLGVMKWFHEWHEERERLRKPEYRRASQLAHELAEHCKRHGISGTFHGIEVKP